MTTIDDYLQKAIFVRDNLSSEVARIIQKNKEEILDLNRGKQLFDRGIDSNGERLKSYSPTTIFFKRQEGKPYDRTTLFNTGSFTNKFDLINRNNAITFFSRDSKSMILQEYYKESSIFGLTTENEKVYNYDIIKPELMMFLKKYL